MDNIINTLKSLEVEIDKLNPVEKLIVASEFIKILKIKGDEYKERR